MREQIQSAYYKLLHPFGNLRTGENIFDTDWDVCIILDACRYDLFIESVDKYHFIDDPVSKISVDSKTDAWTRKTFSRANASDLRGVYYISANPFSREIPEPSQLEKVDHVWEYAWNENNGTVLPRAVTNRAISTFRDQKPKRLLVHYIQPHVPFIPWKDKTPIGRGNFGLDGEGTKHTWKKLESSELSVSEVWKGYKQNLRYVLDEIELLLDNIEGDNVVITSDHGNGIGEWGVYGHPIHIPFNSVRKVPWVVTEAKDNKTHNPDQYDVDTADKGNIQQKLQDLGYVN